MEHLIHRSPSVGSIVKKILAINPDLGVQEIVQLVRKSSRTQGGEAGEYSTAEVVDEKLALELAKETLHRKRQS